MFLRRATGVIKRSVPEGTKVRIGQTIATIDADGKPSAKPAASGGAKNADALCAGEGARKHRRLRPNRKRNFRPPSGAWWMSINSSRRKFRQVGPGGRITKGDVVKYMEGRNDAESPGTIAAPERASDLDFASATPIIETPAPVTRAEGAGQRRVPMSKIRKKIAERLVQAQQTAAILTTFNEIDLHNVIDLRTKFKERFEKVHGVGLGFMSFFARAVVLALKEFERVNGQIDGDDVIYHDYVHLGIAVSTERGLTVPILRNADKMSFAKIEMEIKRLAAATRDGKLSLAGTERRHLHDHQRRRLRLAAVARRSSIRRNPASSACTRSRNAPSPSATRSSSAR